VLGEILNRSDLGEYVVITTHRNADPDALASSIVLYNFVNEILKKNVLVVFPEGVNEVSKKIVKEFNLHNLINGPEVLLNTSINSNFLLIIVDTSSTEQLGPIKNIVNRSNVIISIDHHVGGNIKDLADYAVLDTTARSTSEIVYKILSETYKFTYIDAMLLLAGIIYDTRRFMIATPSTLTIASHLARVPGVDYRKVINLLQTEMDISERIARLKAAQRLSFKRINDYIIAYSYVSAFEGSAARALLDLGADIAVIGSENDEVRIVARAKPSIVKTLGISLGGEIMPLVGKYLKGSGGGHDAAGAACGKGDLFKALNYTVNLIVKKLHERLRGEN